MISRWTRRRHQQFTGDCDKKEHTFKRDPEAWSDTINYSFARATSLIVKWRLRDEEDDNDGEVEDRSGRHTEQRATSGILMCRLLQFTGERTEQEWDNLRQLNWRLILISAPISTPSSESAVGDCHTIMALNRIPRPPSAVAGGCGGSAVRDDGMVWMQCGVSNIRSEICYLLDPTALQLSFHRVSRVYGKHKVYICTDRDALAVPHLVILALNLSQSS